MARRIHHLKMRKQEEKSQDNIRAMRLNKIAQIQVKNEEDTQRIVQRLKNKEKMLEKLEIGYHSRQRLAVLTPPKGVHRKLKNLKSPKHQTLET